MIKSRDDNKTTCRSEQIMVHEWLNNCPRGCWDTRFHLPVFIHHTYEAWNKHVVFPSTRANCEFFENYSHNSRFVLCSAETWREDFFSMEFFKCNQWKLFFNYTKMKISLAENHLGYLAHLHCARLCLSLPNMCDNSHRIPFKLNDSASMKRRKLSWQQQQSRASMRVLVG